MNTRPASSSCTTPLSPRAPLPTVAPVPAPVAIPGMLGSSRAFQHMAESIHLLARSDAPLLIQGETGSGKELAARAVHYLSARQSGPFVPINCGAIPETLLEAELFGHARGAFTDARTARVGLVTHAEGGTLFLDEIDALPYKGQVVLLRFLQDHRYRPLGQTGELTSNARIVVASNRPLEEEVQAGRFRSDLLYRLDILRLHVPPLRDRPDDILLLAQHFALAYATRYLVPCPRIGGALQEWLLSLDWRGNVRELENAMHRLVLQCDGGASMVNASTGTGASIDSDIIDAAKARANFRSAKAAAIASFERDYLTRLLKEARGNVSAAARLACTDRRVLGRMLKKHGISRSL